MFETIRAIGRVLKTNGALPTGHLFFEVEDYNYLKIDDSRSNRFYIREYADRQGDSISIQPFNLTGCGGYLAAGMYVIVCCIDKAIDLEKCAKILLYQIGGVTGVTPKAIGTDPRAIYRFENREELKSSLPFHVVKITVEIREMEIDLRGCDQELCIGC